MQIQEVEYITHHPYPDPETGEKIPVLQPHFKVVLENGQEFQVPLDPANRHYQELAEWYKKQERPPFEYNFEG